MARVVIAIKTKLAILVFYMLRGLERFVSPAALRALLTPFALVWALFEKSQPESGFARSYFRKGVFPEAARRARMEYLLSRIVEFFPDRLITAKWQPRFQTNGLHHIQEARDQGRSVVLVCLHFGTYKLSPFLLRSLGIPVIAVLRGKPQQRSRVKRMKDRLSPFPEIPTVLYSEGELRRTISHLARGHVLLLAVDRQVGKQITVPLDDHWHFQVATGALRIACRCDAEVIPCFMVDDGEWHFRLEILRPVPRKTLASEFTLPQAADYLVQQMLPVVRQHPEQSTAYLRNCFRRNVPEPRIETVATGAR